MKKLLIIWLQRSSKKIVYRNRGGFMSFKILLIGVAISLASFLNMLNALIVNVSLTNIAGDFAIAPSQGTWLITAYAVSEAIVLPLMGYLTARFGTVKQYVWSTLLFTLASFLCGLSFNFESLLFFRLLQGIVGASMIPLSQVLIAKVFPSDKRHIGMTIWSMTLVIGPVLGPVIGGWITYNISWRYCFFFSVPIGLFISALAYKLFKKEYHEEKPQKVALDRFGLLCLILGVGSLQVLLDKGTDLDWFSSNLIISLSVIAFVFLVTLVIWEWNHDHPIIDVKLFLDRNFTIGCLSVLGVYMAFYFSSVLIPLWLQSFMGYTSFQSGKATAVLGFSVLFLSPLAGKLIGKYHSKYIAILGAMLFGVLSIYCANLYLDVPSYIISRLRILQGVGLTFFFVSVNSMTLNPFDGKRLIAASGVYNFVRNMAGSFGTALVMPLWNHSMAYHREVLISNVQLGNPNLRFPTNINPELLKSKLSLLNIHINQLSSVMGVNDVLVIGGLMSLGLIPLLFFVNTK